MRRPPGWGVRGALVLALGPRPPSGPRMILKGSQRLKGPQGVRTFFSHCTALHLISRGRELDVFRRVDLFLGLHLLLGGNLDVCGRVELFLTCADVLTFFFLWSSLILGGNWTSVPGARPESFGAEYATLN